MTKKQLDWAEKTMAELKSVGEGQTKSVCVHATRLGDWPAKNFNIHAKRGRGLTGIMIGYAASDLDAKPKKHDFKLLSNDQLYDWLAHLKPCARKSS